MEEVFPVVFVVVNFVDLLVVGLIDFVVPELIVVVALIVVAEQQTVVLWQPIPVATLPFCYHKRELRRERQQNVQ